MKNNIIVSTFLSYFAVVIGIALAAPLSRDILPAQPKPLAQPDTKVIEYIAEKQKQLDLAKTPKEKELALAVMPDAPIVDISGTVFLPDGSPAAGCFFDVRSIALVRSQNVGAEDSCEKKEASGFGITKENGAFQLNRFALHGANVIIDISTMGDKSYFAKPFTFVALEDMKPLEIRLEEAVPVHGKIMYDNNTPAANRTVFIERPQVEPILGAAVPAMKEMLRTHWQGVRTDADGKFEWLCSPGSHVVRYGKEQDTLKITPFSPELYLNWTMPTPIFVEIERADGTPIGRVDFHFFGGDSEKYFSDNLWRGDRPLIVPPVTRATMLHLVESNLEWGIVATLSPTMVGQTVRFTLQPMSSVAITLLDTDGKPMADERVGLQYSCKLDDSRQTSPYSSSRDDAFTDKNGKAVLRVLPGKVTIKLYPAGKRYNKDDERKMLTEIRNAQSGLERERLLEMWKKRDRYTAETELDLAPGETHDFGTVTVL